MFIAIFLVGNIFKIYLLKDIPNNLSFFGIFVILGVINLVNERKLDNYIEKNYPEKWDVLTPSPFLNKHYPPSRLSGKRARKFLFSKETFNDPIVAYLKNELKKSFLLLIVHFFSIPIFLWA